MVVLFECGMMSGIIKHISQSTLSCSPISWTRTLQSCKWRRSRNIRTCSTCLCLYRPSHNSSSSLPRSKLNKHQNVLTVGHTSGGTPQYSLQIAYKNMTMVPPHLWCSLYYGGPSVNRSRNFSFGCSCMTNWIPKQCLKGGTWNWNHTHVRTASCWRRIW